MADITRKDDRVAFNVHSHPEINKEKPGSAFASKPDTKAVGPSFAQPCIVLGYTCCDDSPPGKYIGFHNINDTSIACLGFDDFLSIVRKIKRDIQKREKATILKTAL